MGCGKPVEDPTMEPVKNKTSYECFPPFSTGGTNLAVDVWSRLPQHRPRDLFLNDGISSGPQRYTIKAATQVLKQMRQEMFGCYATI
jgi:hypothetical protein